MSTENNTRTDIPPLCTYDPEWGSPLATAILELEKLRVKKLSGPVPPYIFFQIKNIFQILESIGSARIEGSRTTLAKYVENIIEHRENDRRDEKDREILNIEKAIGFIEENVRSDTKIDRSLVSEIHKIVVDGLTPPPDGEGSRSPGMFRSISVSITKSDHTPIDPVFVSEYFDELMDFVNRDMETQYHLLAVALSHHRLAWIHPFDNGNGRVVRLFTYALLIKQGFQVKSGRILNPTAIFCMDRDEYYAKLSLADSGQRENVLEWCRYVLEGLRIEIEKIDKLLDIVYLTNSLLLPALKNALERKYITDFEYDILVALVKSDGMSIKSADLEKVIGEVSPVQRSRILGRLKEKGVLIPLKQNGRIYTIGFTNNYLLRSIIDILEANRFIPEFLNHEK